MMTSEGMSGRAAEVGPRVWQFKCGGHGRELGAGAQSHL